MLEIASLILMKVLMTRSNHPNFEMKCTFCGTLEECCQSYQKSQFWLQLLLTMAFTDTCVPMIDAFGAALWSY